VKVENEVQPSPDGIKAFLATEGPVVMVNLLKFKEKASYPDGRDPEISGREAYLRYAREMKKLVEGDGGRFIFGGSIAGILLGQVEDLWDEVGLVEYPSSTSLLKIASTPAFQEIEVHRTAGLEGQLNITAKQDDFA
jgi:uncharacterized protein (DUF1330 family)